MDESIQIWNTALAVQYPGDLGIEISLFQDSDLVINGLPLGAGIEIAKESDNVISVKESPSYGIDLILANSNNIDVSATGTILYHPTNVYLPEVKTYLSNSNDLATLFIGNHALSQLFASINHSHDNIYDPGHSHDDRYPTFNYLNSWFELVNPGTENEYLRVKKSLAGDKEIQAWSDTGWLPPSIWAAMPAPSNTTRGGILLGNLTDPTKFLREDGNWQIVTSGTMDHNALSNKDYASSGHIGFLPDTHLVDFAHSNIATAYDHAISAHNYDPAGTAQAARSAHESAYNHANYNAAYSHSITVHDAAFVGLGNVPNINFSAWFEIVNAGQANEYLRCKKPLAGDYEIQAWTDNGQFPAETIAGIQKVGGGTRFLREDGTWQVVNVSGTWDSISGKPTNVSYWANDAGYVTGTPWTSMGYITGTPWRNEGYITSAGSVNYATSAGSAASASSVAWSGVSGKPTAIMHYAGFTLDANTMPSNSSGFSYTSNCPHTGPIVRFSANDNYDLELQSQYTYPALSFRVRNGDAGTWLGWSSIWHTSNFDPNGKANLSGATFTGVIIAGNTAGAIRVTRVNGGSGNADDLGIWGTNPFYIADWSTGSKGLAINTTTGMTEVRGALDIYPNGNQGNYNEGIRIHASSNDWAAISLGAISGSTGTGAGQWSILRYPGTSSYQLSFTYAGSAVVTLQTSGAFAAYSIQGTSNVAGTGSASYHPSGIYSTGTNWLYGPMYLAGNNINHAHQIYFNTSGAENSNYIGTYGSYDLTLYNGRGSSCRLTLDSNGLATFSGSISSGSISVTGTINCTNVVTASNFQLSSDSRLKQGIKLLNPKRLDITYREYEMLNEPGAKRFGVIAQEVEKRYPELVKTNDQGYKSVSYVDLLIREIAFLKERIEYFERRGYGYSV